MAKLGRPPKKSRTGIDPIAPTLWERIRRNVNAGLLPPIHASEIARLAQHGEITSTEAAAAFRVGEIYGRYERCVGCSRSARSPSYEMGYSGHPPENQQERDEERDRAEQDATKAWVSLQGMLSKMVVGSAELRRLEELCVQNECISPPDVQTVRKILERLAQYFRVVSAGKNVELKRQAKASFRGPNTVLSNTPAPSARKQGADRAAFLSSVAPLIPNASQDQLDKMFDDYCSQRSKETAKLDRDTFRQEKARGPLTKRQP